MHNIFAKILPFILLGIAIVVFAFGLILLTYLFVLGAIIGVVLFAVAWIREKFFPPRTLVKREKKNQIIEHDKK